MCDRSSIDGRSIDRFLARRPLYFVVQSSVMERLLRSRFVDRTLNRGGEPSSGVGAARGGLSGGREGCCIGTADNSGSLLRSPFGYTTYSVIAVLVIVEFEVCGDLASSYLHRSVLQHARMQPMTNVMHVQPALRLETVHKP